MLASADKILAFVIPIRHPQNARRWDLQKAYLEQTLRSIAQQSAPDWTAVIVANEGTSLPDLPANVRVKWVDFPPNAHHDRRGFGTESHKEATRLDKGRRVLAGILETDGYDYVMSVDDDDFLHKDLTDYVKRHRGPPGWYLKKGYVWTDRGRFLYLYDDFSRICGTSHIIRRDLLALPDAVEGAPEQYLTRVTGSHMYFRDQLEQCGRPLAPLPFPGAIYRVGNPGSVSNSTSIWRRYFFNRTMILKPHLIARRVFRLRMLSGARRSAFGLLGTNCGARTDFGR